MSSKNEQNSRPTAQVCLPVGASAAATMGFGNAAYMYLNLSFIQVIGAIAIGGSL